MLDNANTAIRVAQNNTIRGLNIGNTTTTTSFQAGIAGAGIGAPFGTLTVNDMTNVGTGTALYLEGHGSLAVTLTGLSVSASGDHGVRFNGIGGTIGGNFTVTGATSILNTRLGHFYPEHQRCYVRFWRHLGVKRPNDSD